jgi:hypothetical protein
MLQTIALAAADVAAGPLFGLAHAFLTTPLSQLLILAALMAVCIIKYV